MEIAKFLELLAQRNGSDVFLSPGGPPCIKISGVTYHLNHDALTSEETRGMAYALMNERQEKEFEQTMEMNLAVALKNVGRFRVNVYRQRGDVALAARYITATIPSIEALNLPPVLEDLIMTPRGLILVVGSTGSGKSTTLASMIDYRNERRTGHMLTIEEPIEFLHTHKQSLVDQREIGIDTLSYANALKNAMREAPDVILIGEIRDRETMQHAIAYAETGHLCLSTLHANNANQTLDRIINFFPDTARHQLLIDLSLNLRAVVSQRLVRTVDDQRVPAVELLLRTPFVSDLIAKGEIDAIKEAMKQGTAVGMATFDQSLYRLYAAGRISYKEAILNADSQTDLALHIRLAGPAPAEGSLDPEELTLVDIRERAEPRERSLPI
ncbi:MAG TPA: PilT/PilU family type 4a pilus ATPase [Rhodanobacteraceae bacterium]|nr:PilT/PilU family type 4a pilus ATPase [Rhodanobacteraceae bacterium]